MAVKLDIIANVKGQSGINTLQSGLNKLGLNATIASKRLKNLEVAAARSRATFAALGTTLKVGVVASLAAVTFGIGKFVKDTFSAGKLTESLQVRFKLLFGSVEEGAKAFDVMNTFAGKVPFSLEAIAAGCCIIIPESQKINSIDIFTDQLLPENSVYRIKNSDDIEGLVSLTNKLLSNEKKILEKKKGLNKVKNSLKTWDQRINYEIKLLKEVTGN